MNRAQQDTNGPDRFQVMAHWVAARLAPATLSHETMTYFEPDFED